MTQLWPEATISCYGSRAVGLGCASSDVDLVVLGSPRRSHVQILQMGGRATRVAPGKEYGYVLVPIGEATAEGGVTVRAWQAHSSAALGADEWLAKMAAKRGSS